MKQSTDFLIIGAGIVGLTIAREIKRRFRDCTVTLIEKETKIGEHASGRNSGVLHAGFYYTKDSLKAKFTKDGNAALTQYCLEKKVPLNRCGKLVVARNADALKGLHELLQRGKDNGIALELISATDAKEIEPRVYTYEQALFSPTTSSVDPQTVLKHMVADATGEGIQIHLGTKYLSHHHKTIKTNTQDFHVGFTINAAGLYADKIAKDFGFAKDYFILPFKGLYLYASSDEKLRTHIYPVPDLKYPFLGVHFTLTAEGKVKIGPTAIPAFWREQYRGLSRFNCKEMLEILQREFRLLFRAGFDFKGLALHELKKYSRHILTKQAAELIPDIHKNNYNHWGKPGIRAQLINMKTRQLEMDFITEGDSQSLHILNAVSPAFTCSIPFANHVVNWIERHR
jgi:(S)-2-hydroxyglutarate dehydrogenase